MKTSSRTIKSRYSEKQTTVRPKGNHISKIAYQQAIKRMGLVSGDYPILADNGPPIVVDPEYAIID